jgi:hypothetical protein
VALVGGGGRHKQEGTMEHAPDEERGAGSHQGGARTVEVAEQRRHDGFLAAMTRPYGQR